MSGRGIRGSVSPGFERVEALLGELVAADPEYSAQLAVFRRGEPVVDITVGDAIASDAVTGVFSVSKGVSALTFSMLIRQGLVDLDRTVAHYWPEFAAEGKEGITVRQLLSHQAGLIGVQGGFTPDEFIDSAAAAERIATTAPLWRPGSAFGYHGITIGVFLEELTRRIAGTTLQELYEESVRAPRGIDFYLGLPETEDHRYLPLRSGPELPSEPGPVELPPMAPDGYMAHMFNAIGRPLVPVHKDPFTPNLRRMRAAGQAAIGGVGSARGIAAVYAAGLDCATESLLDAPTRSAVTQEHVSGVDRVLGVEAAFAIGFMKPTRRVDFGSYLAFGHDGAGGALGFADPLYDLAFGYLPFPMVPPGGDERYRRLRYAVRECVI